MDQTTLAYVNLYGVLGALPRLCALDPAAKQLAQVKKPFKLGFKVKGGPAATLNFENGVCTMTEGALSLRHAPLLFLARKVQRHDGRHRHALSR